MCENKTKLRYLIHKTLLINKIYVEHHYINANVMISTYISNDYNSILCNTYKKKKYNHAYIAYIMNLYMHIYYIIIILTRLSPLLRSIIIGLYYSWNLQKLFKWKYFTFHFEWQNNSIWQYVTLELLSQKNYSVKHENDYSYSFMICWKFHDYCHSLTIERNVGDKWINGLHDVYHLVHVRLKLLLSIQFKSLFNLRK